MFSASSLVLFTKAGVCNMNWTGALQQPNDVIWTPSLLSSDKSVW